MLGLAVGEAVEDFGAGEEEECDIFGGAGDLPTKLTLTLLLSQAHPSISSFSRLRT